MDDRDLPAFYAGLGLAGVVDIHVHFMPEPVLRKVWAYFDGVPGRGWPIEYRFDEAERLATLRRLGVLAYPALVYPHKPGMARWLNEWAREFAARTDGCASTGTFYPEPGVEEYTREALDAGAVVFKSHLQVGAYDPRDPLLDPVWGMLADAGVPVVCHCGDGPLPGEFTGAGPIGEVLRRHPSLTLVIAHCGLPRYGDFLDLAARYERVHLDTTIAFTDFVEVTAPFPRDRLPQLRDLADRIVLGSDFPNIPHPYAHQIEALARLDLGDDWLRAVLHDNGARLLAQDPHDR
jgi:predicted TIM-barrel fold metal-dependent hydrolase